MALDNKAHGASAEYQDFLLKNRVKVNRYLNTALWLFVLTGPAIALGVASGAFPDISFSTCIAISVVVALMSSIHLVLLKLRPQARSTSMFALTALNLLLVYMTYRHINIQLTWCLVPLFSLLFCDKVTYLYALGMNYALLVATMWLTSPYNFSLSLEFTSVRALFLNSVGGYTIETFIMAIAGYTVVRLTSQYFQDLFHQNKLIREKEKSEQEKLAILNSMTEIYDQVNLIDFVDSTEMSLRDEEKKARSFDLTSQTMSLMNQGIKGSVLPDQLDAFTTYTNLRTVQDRLTNRKIISEDFINVSTGWFRAQYITVEAGPDGRPDVVIYTIRDVDEEKRREEHLVSLSMTDGMTRLSNRRRYEDDLEELKKEPLPEDLVMFSIDVNGLKTVNDNLGHAAGDELIMAAADCLEPVIRPHGMVYRTGGDEFMAIVRTAAPAQICAEVLAKAGEWRGSHGNELAISVGYAALSEHQGATVDELGHTADVNMYAEKERYYRERGIARR